MKIGFLSNKLTLRGTEVCIYDYADMSEKILGHTSIILTRPIDLVKQVSPRDVHPAAYEKFARRFPMVFYRANHEIIDIVKKEGIDVLFIEKAGAADDGLNFPELKTIIHCVFTSEHPHGTLYTVISNFLNDVGKTNYPVLPYIVRVADTTDSLRDELGIPKDAIVLGTYSGADEFNIQYIKDVVERLVTSTKPEDQRFWFVFLNIDPFGSTEAKASPRLKFLPGTADMVYKRKFINTCDAMLYGRGCGETFGLSCGEFAICNKPILAKPTEFGKFHQQMMGEGMLYHKDAGELLFLLHNLEQKVIEKKEWIEKNGYKQFTPEHVIANFQKHLEMFEKKE